MRRAIERYLEDPLAEDVLRGKLNKGKIIEVSAAEDELVFSQKPPTRKQPANK